MAERLALDGLSEELTILTVGYTLTIGEDELSQVVAVCRTPELRYWYPVLDEAGSAFGGGTETLNFPGMDPRGPRVISKRPKRREDEGDQ